MTPLSARRNAFLSDLQRTLRVGTYGDVMALVLEHIAEETDAAAEKALAASECLKAEAEMLEWSRKCGDVGEEIGRAAK